MGNVGGVCPGYLDVVIEQDRENLKRVAGDVVANSNVVLVDENRVDGKFTKRFRKV